ncbi:hypothetical protein DMP06_07935 [Slackia equolifaciens]|uniref:Uncharacterized protein n=1 Tax=Slackia equolifaciens TaxID=498718 RepID=A0A3N0AWH8_9ACTN|nr:hypothetical protein [Slackia equolifaciens]RNL39048.1 hypothetical protein DMP06_07935 [Slackia equolifaciens]
MNRLSLSRTSFADDFFAHTGASRERSSWHGAAFVLEVMLLVAFIAASLAVLAAVFSGAQMRGIEAIRLTDAVTLAASGASNGAEDFAADPEAAYAEGTSTTYYAVAAGSVSPCDPSAANACEVTRVIDRNVTQAGALYDATVTVTRDGEVLYELKTSAYVSARADGAADVSTSGAASTAFASVSNASLVDSGQVDAESGDTSFTSASVDSPSSSEGVSAYLMSASTLFPDERGDSHGA